MQVIGASSSANGQPANVRGVIELDVANATELQVLGQQSSQCPFALNGIWLQLHAVAS